MRLRALWLAPLVVGSLAVGSVYFPGSAQAAGKAASAGTAGTGTLEICKSADNGMLGRSFSFTDSGYGGGSVSVTGGACSRALTVTAGANTVTEAATSDTVVTDIDSSPTGTLTSENDSARTATVNVPAGGPETVVTYFNKVPPAMLKVCKQAAPSQPQLIGQPFSFTINGGQAFTVNAGPAGKPNCSGLTTYAAGTNVTVQELAPVDPNIFVSNIGVLQPPASNVNANLAARSVSLTVGSGVNIVTYTNNVKVSTTPGYLEICKNASDEFVTGNFSYTIMDANGKSHGPYTVLVGQCSNSIQLPSGNATITEASVSPYFLDDVWTYPSDRLASDNLTNQTATVSIVAGDQSNETVAFFENNTNEGAVKVCKTLTSNSSALTGTTFTFPWTASWTSPSGVTFNFSGTATVVASAPGQSACTFLDEFFPVGTHVSITENGTPNVLLTGVSVVPSSWDNGSTSTTANLTVLTAGGIGIATFTNEALGTLEICKDAADNQTKGKSFTFTITDNSGPTPFSTTVTVQAGFCSPSIAVPAGTATVTEGSTTNFHLVKVTATGPDGSDRLISLSGSSATVSVPFGGVENETLVRFTNAVNTGEFKICKTNTGGGLGGRTFYFSWNYSVDGQTTSGTTSMMPGQCVISGPIPVEQSNGSAVTVNVTETATTGTHVQSITFAGNWSNTSSNTATGMASGNLGQGVNTITYDNELNPLGGVPGRQY